MIIVTRPSPYGEELTQLCNSANFPAKHLPLFKIEPGTHFNELQDQLNQLSKNDIVIIVSPQVSHIIQYHQLSIAFPDDVHYFAVGKHSAELFAKLCNQPVDYPKQHENSEGLINYLKDIQLAINHHKVLILSGDASRTMIKSKLEEWGAKVINIPTYKRTLINYPKTVLAEDSETKNIVITSVEHLLQLENYCNDQHKNQYPLIVSAIRIVREAKLRGWKHVYLAKNANNQNLFKTITTLCHNASIVY